MFAGSPEDACELADQLNDRFACGPDVLRFETISEDEIDGETRERWHRAADDPRLVAEADRPAMGQAELAAGRWMLRDLSMTAAQQDVVARAAWLVIRNRGFFASPIGRVAADRHPHEAHGLEAVSGVPRDRSPRGDGHH